MDFHAHYGRLCRLRLPHSTHKICISGKKSHSIEMPMIHYTIFSDIMQVFFRNFHNIFMQSAPTPELRHRLPYLAAPVEKSWSDDSFFSFLFHKNRRWVFHRFQQLSTGFQLKFCVHLVKVVFSETAVSVIFHKKHKQPAKRLCRPPVLEK